MEALELALSISSSDAPPTPPPRQLQGEQLHNHEVASALGSVGLSRARRKRFVLKNPFTGGETVFPTGNTGLVQLAGSASLLEGNSASSPLSVLLPHSD